MTKAMQVSKAAKADTAPTLLLRHRPGEADGLVLARAMLEPEMQNASAASDFAKLKFASSLSFPKLMDYSDHVREAADKTAGGDIALVSRMLTAQAITLDNMFTELARRAAMNLGSYIDATERYARIALKAQANCRTTLEALAKLHQPREQTVRHVHVNEGGQAIVADQFHNHPGGGQSADPVEQSHATGILGQSAPLSCPDTQGDGLSVGSGEGAGTMPDARRD